MKKIISIVIIGLFVILVTGCFGNNDDTGNDINISYDHNIDGFDHLDNIAFIKEIPAPLPGIIFPGRSSGGLNEFTENQYLRISFEPLLTQSEGKAYIELLKSAGYVEHGEYIEFDNGGFSWSGNRGSFRVAINAHDINISKRD